MREGVNVNPISGSLFSSNIQSGTFDRIVYTGNKSAVVPRGSFIISVCWNGITLNPDQYRYYANALDIIDPDIVVSSTPVNDKLHVTYFTPE